MGFEYTARPSARVTATQRIKLLQAVRENAAWSLVAEHQGSVHVAFRTHEYRPEWPEDFVLELGDSEIHVLFHSGSAQERRQVLEYLVERLREVGLSCLFEEE